MSETMQAVMTAAANIIGYLLLVAVTVYGLVAVRRRFGWRRFPYYAAAALVLDFAVIFSWYVGTVYWLDSYPHADQPPWLDATSGAAENLQSEVWQVWMTSLVFTWLEWRRSPESKESDELDLQDALRRE